MDCFSHYNSISAKYEQNMRLLEDQYYTENLNDITRLLELKPTDILADIGFGGGFLAAELHKNSNLKSPVWAVDPNLAIKKRLENRSDLKYFAGDLKQFCESGIKIDKCLMRSMIHHLNPLFPNLNALHSIMNPNGVALISARLPKTKLPFFEAAKISFEKSTKPIDFFLKCAEMAGFKCELEIREYPVTLEKSLWLKIVSERFMSNLSDFSEKELKEGLEEIDSTHRGTVLSFVDTVGLLVCRTQSLK